MIKFKIFDDALKNEVFNEIIKNKNYTFDDAVDITNCVVKLLDYNVIDADIVKKICPKLRVKKIKVI